MSARLVVDEACPHCGAALRLEVQAEVAAAKVPEERLDVPPGLFDATADDLAAVETGVRPATWMVPDIVTNGTASGGGVFERDTFDAPLDQGEADDLNGPAPEYPGASWMPPPGWKPDPNQRYGAPVEDVVLKPGVIGGQGIEPVPNGDYVELGDIHRRGEDLLDVLNFDWKLGTAEVRVLPPPESSADEPVIESVSLDELRKLPLVRRQPHLSRFYGRAMPHNGDMYCFGTDYRNAFFAWQDDDGWLLLKQSPLRLHGVEYCVSQVLDVRKPWTALNVLESLFILKRGASKTPPHDVPEEVLYPTEATLDAAIDRLRGKAADWADTDFCRTVLEAMDLATRVDSSSDSDLLDALAKKLCAVWGAQAKSVAYSTSPVNVQTLWVENSGRGTQDDFGWRVWEAVRRVVDAS